MTHDVIVALAVLGVVGQVLGAGLLLIGALALVGVRGPLRALRSGVEGYELWLAFVVAAIATGGSLFFSEIAHFVPCELCWYQRICMYPLFVTLLVGGLRKDREVYAYVLPPAIIGTGFAIYHTQLQAFPQQHGPFCKGFDPCTVRYVWEFGFVSIPFMSLAAFAFIITMMVALRGARNDDVESEDFEESAPDDELSLSGQGVS